MVAPLFPGVSIPSQVAENEAANDGPHLAGQGGEETQQLYVFKDVGQKPTPGVMMGKLNRRGHIS